jgi:anti-anti-sigma factor
MNARPDLAIVTEHHSQRSVLRPHGELDASNTDRLRRAISGALERHPPIIVVDLSELSFADCAGLSVLVWAHKLLARRGHELLITGAKPAVQRLLHLTDLDTYLHLSTPDAAMTTPGPGQAPGSDSGPPQKLRSSCRFTGTDGDLHCPREVMHTMTPPPERPQPKCRRRSYANGSGPRPYSAAGSPNKTDAHRRRVIAAALFAVLLLLLLIFILQNGQRVSMSYFGAHGHLPLGVALLLAAVPGVLVVVIPGTGRIIQLRITARRHRRLDATAAAPSRPPAGTPSPNDRNQP